MCNYLYAKTSLGEFKENKINHKERVQWNVLEYNQMPFVCVCKMALMSPRELFGTRAHFPTNFQPT